jgi:hypothetical protein
MKVAEIEALINMIEVEKPAAVILENLMEVLVAQVVVIETMKTKKFMILRKT